MHLYNDTPFPFAWLVRRAPKRGNVAIFIVKATFRLRQDEIGEAVQPQPALSVDQYQDGALRYPSDFAQVKPCADVVLVGHAYAPEGRPVPMVRPMFSVGSLSKTLSIYGDRYWIRDGEGFSLSDPVPFLRMALTPENAFGGPGFAKNPIGKGYVQETDPPLLHVSNIEDPAAPIQDRLQRPDPAGFGPLPLSSPDRLKKAGTFDARWIGERWPLPPADFDPASENAAPTDQQFDGYLRGDEPLRFLHLRPNQPFYDSRLPGIRIRCFHGRSLGSGRRFREVPMHLDTLWMDLDEERLVLVWRGSIDIPSERLEDDDFLAVRKELLTDSPASVDEVLEGATRNLEADSALPELFAAAAAAFPEEKLPVPAKSREWCLKRIASREGFRGQDLTGADLSELDLTGVDFRESILQKAKLAKSKLVGADLSDAVLTQADLSAADLRWANLTRSDLVGAVLNESVLVESVLDGAELSRARLRRSDLTAAHGEGACFARADLTSAKLTSARFPEADFSYSTLNDAILTEAILQRASFFRALGCRIVGERAVLAEVRAAGAHLGECNFREAIAPGSVWLEANLYLTDFSGADLERTEFEGAYLLGAQLRSANLRSARLARSQLRQARVSQADLLDATLERADLTGADFTGSNLFAVNLAEAELEGACFDRANLQRTRLSP